MNKVLLSLGSNIGNKIVNLEKAKSLIEAVKGINLLAASSYYKSEPYGFKDQDWFINNCLLIETKIVATDLLKILKNIEIEIGRKPRQKWHEREIDIDIILYAAQIINSKLVQIPHPEMHKRNFVLFPAVEIASSMMHPTLNLSVKELKDISKDKSKVLLN
ncbi:2-amino-4-hydroxy-6-hydroxymethyldihydropteridine diphosphokinase [Candidatus Kapabacteria bacterium]|nr:2-amino-4-hydroxy-6-hydroxymethyldihydropteridine diphosphokinase [Candidatus Kapabacteria bacterium]